jgi:hypothetical protein
LTLEVTKLMIVERLQSRPMFVAAGCSLSPGGVAQMVRATDS